MNYLYHHRTLKLVPVGWTDPLVWVPRSALPSPRDPQFAAQPLAFNHPRLGAHSVYVDIALLEETKLPRPDVYERIGLLLERQIAAEKVGVDLAQRRAS